MSLYDIVRPSAGWEFDAMVICTYSADLRSVLSLPAALAAADSGSSLTPRIGPSELAILRRICDRTLIFCQEAAILGAEKLPSAVIETESMIHAVTAPGGGAFHPKIWLVRFRNDHRFSYRLAVMSRNLTADRSWDIGVVMEGKLSSKGRADGLSDVLEALPGRCRRSLRHEHRSLVEAFAKDAKTLHWTPPTGLRKASLHAYGLGKVWQTPKYDSLLVLSPFLDRAAIKALAPGPKKAALILSRRDALDRCWSSIESRFERKAVLSTPIESSPDMPFGALHAKAYFWQRGGECGLALGSMNATSPGMDGRNVEFMAHFDASASLPGGLPSLLEQPEFGQLLIDYEPDPNQPVAEQPLDDRPARRAICDLELSLDCEPGDEEWTPTLVARKQIGADHAVFLEGLTFRPATTPRTAAVPCLPELNEGGRVRFSGALPLSMITGFTVFEGKHVEPFTLNLEVTGVADDDRRRAVLRSLLPDERSFMSFMRAWLGDGGSLDQTIGADGEGQGAWEASGIHGGILEMLVRCAADTPERLKEIDEAIRSFGEEELERLAPKSFRKLWKSLTGDAKA